MTNREIAECLQEMSLYEQMFDVPFKPAAYERAAEAVAGFGEEVAKLFAEAGVDGLMTVPGVGPNIAKHIAGLLQHGTFKELATYRRRVPVDLPALTAIEGIGPKTVLTLYRRLKITDLDGLERAAKAGKIAGLPHFGRKTQANILAAVERRRHAGTRRILGYVLPVGEQLTEDIRHLPGVVRASVAGSLRRRQETVGDIDLVAASDRPVATAKGFAALPAVADVIESGETMVSVHLKNGLRADLRIVPSAVYGAALQHFTGSKDHNVEIRKLAAAAGLKLNEYGLWRGRRRLAAHTEEEVYRALGLAYIEPELRVAEGELAAAAKGKLPKLIEYGAVRGDLQVQTDWTDGTASIETMIKTARQLGREYLAVTDHTKALGMTGGLDEKKLAAQSKAIDRLNAGLRGEFHVLKGAETNILKDGSIDIADATLAKLDFVGASIHTAFKLSREEQTRRMIVAMRHPHVDGIFHPTGRIINGREPYELDITAVLKAAKATGTAMEIDAFPDRSDLRDAHVRLAVKLGVKLIIDTDAHAPEHLAYLDLGVAIARRGWASAKDILNTRRLPELMKWLKTPKNKRR